MDTAEYFLEDFRAWSRDDRSVKALLEKANARNFSYKDAQRLASITGKKLGNMIADVLVDAGGEWSLGSLDIKMLTDFLNKGILANYNLITPVIKQAQMAINRALNVDLNPLVSKYPAERVNGLAKEIDERGIHAVSGELPRQVENISMSTVDDSMKENVRFMGNAGFDVKVSRYYDHVGVNHRKEACQWCLDRCGVDVPYRDAIDKGMFERHTGCGCTLYYTAGRTTRRQANWETNQWV